MHIHKYGDPSIHLMGGHYDKHHKNHPNHTGDLKNIYFYNGHAKIKDILTNVKLEQLYGRGLVIHKNCDDYGHIENGHSGKIFSHGIIARSKEFTLK